MKKSPRYDWKSTESPSPEMIVLTEIDAKCDGENWFLRRSSDPCPAHSRSD